MQYKGVNYTSTWNSDYLNSTCATNCDQLKSTGASWAQVFIPLVMASATANVVTMNTTTLTPTDAAVVKAISDLHTRGIAVGIHFGIVDPNGSVLQANVNPSNMAAWFASYGAAVTHYATIAQANGVEMFSIGTEMDTIDVANLPLWTTLISSVRTCYKGPLSYSANWYKYTKTCFWGLLDVLGIDGYFPLSNSQTPTVAEIVAAWSGTNPQGRNWMQELQTFQAAQGKPLIFTEIGFESADYPAEGNPGSGSYNPMAQANCYEGTYQAFANATWFSGLFWWQWFPNTTNVPLPGSNMGWTPQYKTAQTVMKKYWGGGTTTQLLASKSGTSNTAYGDTQVATTVTCVSPATGTIGTAVNITGKLTRNDTGAGVAGQPVQLQLNGADVTGKTATTAADGSYTISYTETVIRTDAFDVTFAGATV